MAKNLENFSKNLKHLREKAGYKMAKAKSENH